MERINGIKKVDVNKYKNYIAEFWEESPLHLDLRSAYDCYKSTSLNNEPDFAYGRSEFTVYTQEFIGTLYYVVYSAKHFQVTQVLNVPTHDPEVKSAKIPNGTYPSDHFNIPARFKFI
jgi:mRNA deadenylase 3'-5' endonuclease subunit Ccr4